MKFHVVWVHPEIPANTGNIRHLCANTHIHLPPDAAIVVYEAIRQHSHLIKS